MTLQLLEMPPEKASFSAGGSPEKLSEMSLSIVNKEEERKEEQENRSETSLRKQKASHGASTNLVALGRKHE